MAINTAEVLENDSVLSEFAGGPATPAPVTPMRAPARTIPSRRVKAGRALTAKRRRVRVDWYLLGIILLLLTAVTVCIHRLGWAMQP